MSNYFTTSTSALTTSRKSNYLEGRLNINRDNNIRNHYYDNYSVSLCRIQMGLYSFIGNNYFSI